MSGANQETLADTLLKAVNGEINHTDQGALEGPPLPFVGGACAMWHHQVSSSSAFLPNLAKAVVEMLSLFADIERDTISKKGQHRP